MVWVLCRCGGNISFFYWFQGRNLLVDDPYFKRGGDIEKRQDQISSGESFFLMSHFVPVIPVSPDTTLKERCLG